MEENINLCDKNHFAILKGIAILSIIFGHIGNYTGKNWFTPLGGIGVAIFLFCSGYGLTLSAQNGFTDYWKKKFLNVYLSFFILELIVAVVLKRTFIIFLYDVTFLKIIHPYGWYMQYILFCYLIFYLVFRFIKHNNLRLYVLLILGIISFFAFPNLQGE